MGDMRQSPNWGSANIRRHLKNLVATAEPGTRDFLQPWTNIILLCLELRTRHITKCFDVIIVIMIRAAIILIR